MATDDRRRHMRALVLAAAKARAKDALAGAHESQAPLFAPFSPSPHSLVAALWELLAAEPEPMLGPNDLLVDLGCGDGRWLLSGVERFNCSAFGIEIDPELVDRCRSQVAARGLEKQIQVQQGDVMSVDISAARLVIVYAFAESLPGIRDHLRDQLTDGASVLSIGVRCRLNELADGKWCNCQPLRVREQFHVPEWTPRRSGRIEGRRWYLYDMVKCR